MAAGKAVVATRVGGVPEILDDGVTGLLVPPRNPAGLASALAAVLTERDLAARLGARALAAVQRRFSQDARTAALMSLYQAVAAT
jgi:glycosyltransferase involved in cell wall biosynthesis